MIHMKNRNKKGTSKILGTVITFILLIAFFILVATLFFGDGVLNQAFEKAKNLLKERPEVDSGEEDFFRRNDAQLNFLSSWQSSIKTAFEDPTSYGGCILTLQPVDQEGFYAKDANYNLYIEQEGEDVSFRLTRYAVQGVGPNAKQVETPVTIITIPDTKLCTIRDVYSDVFYNEFNDINKGETPDITKLVSPIVIDGFLLSSGKTGDTERQIGLKYGDGYLWEDFFEKKDKTSIYALRVDWNNKKYLCFFPLHNDKLDDSCGKPYKNDLSDSDCFDSDAGKRSIKYNIDNGLIPAYYICKSP